MLKKLTFFFLIIFIGNSVVAQDSDPINSTYVNLFISADKTIFVETEKTDFENVEQKVSKMLRNKPFKVDQPVTYRIFADEKLKMGFLIDINQELLSAHKENVRFEKYLLNTTKLDIDGANWFDSIDLKKLKKVN
ncbi:biopolymer transporter ExbD [Christiangramia sp.]|uniref:biopolymer transporter ExbD n=1 Tax=Christiangramia sp. TaxID=1931228 RepID=UPI0026146C17|nr:biopolymer transporter ExbD [Christiangramia sp.]